MRRIENFCVNDVLFDASSIRYELMWKGDNCVDKINVIYSYKIPLTETDIKSLTRRKL